MSSMESSSETESNRYSSGNEQYQIKLEASVSDYVLELDDSRPRADSQPRANSLEPNADEPLVDEAWLAKYRKEREEKDQVENELKQCLENSVRVQD
ncbi:hypothetical protein AWC38_SpisGene25170, partial [Stylophora pistillata]